MDQEVEIINTNTRNEKIKNFFIKNKKFLITIFIIIILFIFSFFYYQEYKESINIDLAEKYNFFVTKFESEKNNNIIDELKNIINKKDKTYSPLAFYFLLDNNLINSKDEINSYFDILINEVSLEEEIKNLTIYKKGLFNSDFAEENILLDILNPLIKSESIWRSHALYLMAEYYFAKNQKNKSKDFFEQIINIENANPNIKLESQKRLRANFSE